MTWFKRDDVIEDLQRQIQKFLDDNDATIVETDDVSIDELMDDCFASRPAFGEDPKPEFPDAITVQGARRVGRERRCARECSPLMA